MYSTARVSGVLPRGESTPIKTQTQGPEQGLLLKLSSQAKGVPAGGFTGLWGEQSEGDSASTISKKKRRGKKKIFDLFSVLQCALCALCALWPQVRPKESSVSFTFRLT